MEARNGHTVVFRADLIANAVPPGPCGGDGVGPRSGKWIDNNISGKAEHAYQALSQLDRIRRRMVFCRGSCEAGPNLLKPTLIILRADDGKQSLCSGGFSISARFAKHQNVLNVVLDYRVWLIRFAQKAAPPRYFVDSIRYFVPDDRSQIVKADFAAKLLNRGMKRHNGVPAVVLPSRKAHIAYYADQPPTWDQQIEATFPDAV